MKKFTAFLLAAAMLCMMLAACVSKEAQQTEKPTDAVESPMIPTVESPDESVLDSVSPTLPDIEMPTKPEADYQLPPGEEPTVTVIGK